MHICPYTYTCAYRHLYVFNLKLLSAPATSCLRVLEIAADAMPACQCQWRGRSEIKGINLVKFASESSAYQTRVGIRMSRLARSLARSPLSRSPEPTYGFGNARVHSTVYIVCPRHKAYTDRWPQALLSGLAVAPPAQINNSIDSIRSNASSHYVASRQRQRRNRIVDKKKMQITPICRLFLILNSFPLSAVRRLTLAACSKDLNTRGKRRLS